ncbi:tripartite tricarboxylate transporter substrate binding protein [Microbacterium profundi]|uniref:Tripartite tricarboxylate transporter substrate binding protein n=1 Tax=Microbacterium profundi TaxID=450380 RepID=A0ABV3LD51_9MICO
MFASKRLAAVAVTLAFAAVLSGCTGSNSAPDAGGESGEAADFPTDNINMIVSYAAGGPTDVAGRSVAKFMEQDLGVTVVVENKEGASGTIGTGEVVRSAPDGYTIGMTTASAASRVPMFQEVGFQLEDVQPIGVVTSGPGLVLVKSDSPYKTIDDLMDAAKAKPGTLNFGSAGAGAPQHVEFQRLKDEYGIDITLVPFQGEAPAVTALLGDNIDGCFCSNAQTTMAQVDAGEFRILAVGTPERLGWIPDVPTLAESGFEDLIYGNSYFVLVAPKGIPAEHLAILEGSVERALEDPATREVIGEVRLLEEFMGADALQKMMEDEQVTLGPVLKKLFG